MVSLVHMIIPVYYYPNRTSLNLIIYYSDIENECDNVYRRVAPFFVSTTYNYTCSLNEERDTCVLLSKQY